MSRHSTTKHFLFFSFLFSIVIIILVILASNNVDAADPTAQPIVTPIPGGTWGGVGELYGRYPNLSNNTEVTGFIDTYGLSHWYDPFAYREIDRNRNIHVIYRYTYLEPATNSSIRMVFLINTSGARGEEVVLWTRIINASEELPPLTADDIQNYSRRWLPSVLPDNATDQNATKPGSNGNRGTSAIPGFTGVVAVMSVLLAIMCKKKYR